MNGLDRKSQLSVTRETKTKMSPEGGAVEAGPSVDV